MNKLAPINAPPLCYTFEEAAQAIRWSRHALREEMDRGRLRYLMRGQPGKPGKNNKDGKRSQRIVIRADALRDFLDLVEREQAAK